MRPTLGVLQILDSSYDDEDYMYALKFGFSSKFMYRNTFLESIGRSDQLMWLLKIQPYECADASNSTDEEEVATWLSRW